MTVLKSFNFFHTTPIQIRFNDIDKLDHASNSVYQQYYDLGRIKYFDEVLEEQMDFEVEGLVLAGISIDFLYPIKLYDDVVVRTKIFSIGNKSLKMSQELYNKTTGKIASTSLATLVGYNNNQEVTITVPERWRMRIVAYEHDILFEV